ncbi:methionyl-tRNA formyltransferase [Candidatus Blochmanniella vafra str. BVAF]|uniref:Methionyl-tRNA formyltransferase n=1 Tax=Blochmanniella vafra (strain BVAF) TaxID=859654 RepID=E8Q604_BLOVB|nr:methionyl-tRNA formyltransferase [Candidatus Blochmannia vafer]ADV33620.1 methionyl-tRNA formyltransferase [Candidatus Blochmannia vafer str. BVAF]
MKFQLQQILRIVFFGTGEFAAYHLYTLINCSAHTIIAIFTQEPQILNKKTQHYFSIYHIIRTYNLPLFQSNTLSMFQILQIIKHRNIDIIIVVSYGLILSKEILSIPKLGCINVHGSLLPRWRGPAPIQRALEHGDIITGISIIQIDSGIDTGNILYTQSCKILPKETSYSLCKKLAYIGSVALLQTMHHITMGTCKNIPQNPLYATYAPKVSKLEARINWKNSAEELERRIRAFNPWPISYFQLKTKRIKVWGAEINNNSSITTTKPHPSHPFHSLLRNDNLHSYSFLTPGTILKINSKGIYVATGNGTIILTILQIPGKKKTPVKCLLNSYSLWFPINAVLK